MPEVHAAGIGDGMNNRSPPRNRKHFVVQFAFAISAKAEQG